MIILDYQDRRPIYEQITERFRTLIYQGALPAGSRLPSVRQGKRQFCCGDHTDTGKEQGGFSKGISGIGKKRTTDGSYGRRDAFAGSKEL